MVLGQEEPVIEGTDHLHNVPEYLAQNIFSNAHPVFGSNSTHIGAYTLPRKNKYMISRLAQLPSFKL